MPEAQTVLPVGHLDAPGVVALIRALKDARLDPGEDATTWLRAIYRCEPGLATRAARLHYHATRGWCAALVAIAAAANCQTIGELEKLAARLPEASPEDRVHAWLWHWAINVADWRHTVAPPTVDEGPDVVPEHARMRPDTGWGMQRR